MKNEENVIKCPYSKESHKVIKHGTRNGNQRYYCKVCKKAFQPIKKRVRYSANEKTLLALLVSILQIGHGVKITDMLQKVDDILPNIDKYRMVEFETPNFGQIACYNPRLLIGISNNTLMLYKMTPEQWKENKITLKDTLLKHSNETNILR